MRLTGDWLSDPRTGQVFDAIEGAGYRLYFVGGAVRNAVFGLPVTDIDLSTDARPDAIIRAAEAAGLRAVPTGLDHGTVTVVADGLAHEITTFRRDIDTDGRRAKVAFSDRLENDAARRDFTINALYADRSGTVIDPVGGLDDLIARRVRFVGDASARIREDYLRILRYFRFHAHYADSDAGFDPETMAAIAANSAGLETLSAERVGREMLRLLEAPNPAPEVAAMAASGVLMRILPGADPDTLTRLIDCEVDVPPDAIRRLAALGGVDAKDRLRLSNAEARQLDTIVQAASTLSDLAEVAWKDGPASAWNTAFVRAAMTATPVPQNAGHRIALGATAELPVTAADLMTEFEGPALGAELKRLERRWIESDFTLTRADLLPKG